MPYVDCTKCGTPFHLSCINFDELYTREHICYFCYSLELFEDEYNTEPDTSEDVDNPNEL